MPNDAGLYPFTSPLTKISANLEVELEDKFNPVDNKSYINPPREGRSDAYTTFTDPISNSGPTGSGAFDAHIYYLQANEKQARLAKELWEAVRREFPELRVYRFWDRSIGPHPVAMFEVNLFTPEQFGAFVPWLMIHRGPLSVLVHPNTDDAERDHTERAVWLGHPWPLNTSNFERAREIRTKIYGGEN